MKGQKLGAHILLRDREKGKFKMFYSTQNRNLNFPAAAAETFKGGDPRKVKAATTAETFKGGHPETQLLLIRENHQFKFLYSPEENLFKSPFSRSLNNISKTFISNIVIFTHLI